MYETRKGDIIMQNVISEMLTLFGIDVIPTDFPSFMYWLCSLVAGLTFLKFCVGICFNFISRMCEVRR